MKISKHTFIIIDPTSSVFFVGYHVFGLLVLFYFASNLILF